MPALEDLLQEAKAAPKAKGFIKKFKASQGPCLIAEVKKASPSKGVLREDFDHLEIAQAYEAGGAHCLSVLTDKDYFQGNISYLKEISETISLPCLRKDFIIDPRQVAEARIAGADAILLIAAILEVKEIKALHGFANELGMDVLLEVHNQEEMDKALKTSAELIGINNRDLKTFDVSLETSKELIKNNKAALEGKILVSESGIYSPADISQLYQAGAKVFLVGESLVKEADIKAATEQLIKPH